jgi:hypothetical protein
VLFLGFGLRMAYSQYVNGADNVSVLSRAGCSVDKDALYLRRPDAAGPRWVLPNEQA